MARDFPRFKAGDPIAAWHLNLIFDELRRWRKLTAAAPLQLDGASGGDAPQLSLAGLLPAVIVLTSTVVTPGSGAAYGTGSGTLLADDLAGSLVDTTTKVNLKNLTEKQVATGKRIVCLYALGSYWVTVPQRCADLS